jgi:KUP system potassium uptake protein
MLPDFLRQRFPIPFFAQAVAGGPSRRCEFIGQSFGVPMDDTTPKAAPAPNLGAVAVAALGVVFGDIGTSPLYTLKTVLEATGTASVATAYGVLSLIVWTLIIITTVKYVMVAMRVDNDGEGGILALMSLLGVKRQHRAVIVAVGLFGAALIYGDGAITPAISVLSALEGLQIAAPSLSAHVLPAAVVILVALFMIQPQGTARIGRLFGPIMLLWFLSIGLLGLWGIAKHPSVLIALSPTYAIAFLLHGGSHAFFVLGAVFLCVTGAEALYADMGHFGATPIRLAWSVVVFPCLVLNYAGQAALVAEGASTQQNIFYMLCPQPLLLPLILLATVATIIASQSIITGAYSMTRQAIQLGWMPRLIIKQTSKEGYGQIYVGAVNWILMIVTVGLALGFKKSDNLAAAYGIAVSATMLMTTVLLFIAMRELWRWNILAAGALAGGFFIVDASFFTANMVKVAEGGYVPLLLAACVYFIMYIWHRGIGAINDYFRQRPIPIDRFIAGLSEQGVVRAKGTAVFITRCEQDTPPIIDWYVKQNRCLREKVVALTVATQSVPYVEIEKNITIEEIAPQFWRIVARIGFIQKPDVPRILRLSQWQNQKLDFSDMTYFVGVETIVPGEGHKMLPRWMEMAFAAMERNAAHVTDYLYLPPEKVFEVGRQIAI